MNNENALAISKPADLTKYLQKSIGSIQMALPKHLNAERMVRLAVTCFSTTPALRQCTPTSILGSIIVASQVGLEPGIAGQGYLIPYKQTCTFVPGWQGLVGLLNNSGRATAWTGAVFEGDTWEFQLGSSPKCVHIPGPNFGDADKMTWVYACGQVNGSDKPVVEAWPINRVWKHRDRFNKVGNKHYSFAHPEMYARKVVLLQVLKYMPRSIELNNAMEAANAAEAGHRVEVEGGTVIDVGEIQSEPTGIQRTEPVKAATATATPSGGTLNLVKGVRGLLKMDGIEEATLLNALKSAKGLDETIMSLEELNTVNPSMLLKVYETWGDIAPELKKHAGK